jgi:hypothetical protein
MMITTTRNAAISDSARSDFFDLRVSALSSIEDMTQILEPAYFEVRPRFGKANL